MRNEKEEWNEEEYTDIAEEKVPPMQGFDETSASHLQPLIERSMETYVKKSADAADASWLDEYLQVEFPEKSAEEIQAIRQFLGILAGHRFDRIGRNVVSDGEICFFQQMPLRDFLCNLLLHNSIGQLINVLRSDGIKKHIRLFPIYGFQFRVELQIRDFLLPKFFHGCTKVGRFLFYSLQKILVSSLIPSLLLIL